MESQVQKENREKMALWVQLVQEGKSVHLAYLVKMDYLAYRAIPKKANAEKMDSLGMLEHLEHPARLAIVGLLESLVYKDLTYKDRLVWMDYPDAMATRESPVTLEILAPPDRKDSPALELLHKLAHPVYPDLWDHPEKMGELAFLDNLVHLDFLD